MNHESGNAADDAAGQEPEHDIKRGEADEPDNSATVMTIIRLFRAIERIDAGITPQQYRMLKLVGSGGERSARLAERLTVAKPTLTATADALVAAGLLSREAETADRRVVRLRLTPAGRAAVSHADQVYSDWVFGLLEAAGASCTDLPNLALLDIGLDRLRSARRSSPGVRPSRSARSTRLADGVRPGKAVALVPAAGPGDGSDPDACPVGARP